MGAERCQNLRYYHNGCVPGQQQKHPVNLQMRIELFEMPCQKGGRFLRPGIWINWKEFSTTIFSIDFSVAVNIISEWKLEFKNSLNVEFSHSQSPDSVKLVKEINSHKKSIHISLALCSSDPQARTVTMRFIFPPLIV